MSAVKLTEREELVLQAVVHSYITTAEPAGSRTIVKRFGLDISPATVRNVMADLEEAGYLQQLHTSSGRIPTDHGYRYYVDYLMRVQEITREERSHISNELNARLNDADDILNQTSRLLALISHQTSIVQAPNEKEAVVRHIELLPLDGRRAAVLVEDSYGRVRTFVMPLDDAMTPADTMELNRFLNENLQGVGTHELASAIRSRLMAYVERQRKLAERALYVLDLLPANRPGQLFLEGTTQIFEQPEFRDVDKAREIFGMLEERDRVMEILRSGYEANDPRLSRVRIGVETLTHGMEEISVVSAPYRIGDRTVGMLGIVGPRRMPYAKLTGIVEYTADKLSRLLSRLSGQ